MSRAYRIKVREGLRRHVRAKDSICTELELLGILPAEQMAELLAAELEARGFERQDGTLARTADGVTVRVDPTTGAVTVQAEVDQQVEIEGEKSGWGDAEGVFRQRDKQIEQDLRAALRQELETQVQQQAEQLQSTATDKLEAALGDLRRELDQAVNRVTAEALKQRAAQIGQIKELTEDPHSGSLTIVLEV